MQTIATPFCEMAATMAVVPSNGVWKFGIPADLDGVGDPRRAQLTRAISSALAGTPMRVAIHPVDTPTEGCENVCRSAVPETGLEPARP